MGWSRGLRCSIAMGRSGRGMLAPGFMHWTVEQGVVTVEAAEWLAGQYEGYKAGSVSELAICGDMVRVFAGLSDAAMREAARVFFAERIERHLFPEMLELVGRLQRAGC